VIKYDNAVKPLTNGIRNIPLKINPTSKNAFAGNILFSKMLMEPDNPRIIMLYIIMDFVFWVSFCVIIFIY
jgi:hypothetical protein